MKIWIVDVQHPLAHVSTLVLAATAEQALGQAALRYGTESHFALLGRGMLEGVRLTNGTPLLVSDDFVGELA